MRYKHLLLIIIIFIISCDNHDFNNPVDSDYWSGKEIPPLTAINKTVNTIDNITLNWTIDADIYPEGYKFRIDKKIGSDTWVEKYKLISQTKTSVADTAEINQILQYRIFVSYDENISTPKELSYVNTFPEPSNLIAAQTSITSSNLTWEDNSIGEEKFEIERKLSPETTYAKIGEVEGSDITTKSWIDSNLIANSTYDYRVKAVKESNSSEYEDCLNYYNEFRAPTGLTVAQVNPITATITCNDTYSGEDNYEVWRKLSTEDEPAYQKIYDISGSDTSTKTYTDTTLTPDLIYNYKLRIADGASYSTYSSEITHENTFIAPTNLIVTETTETSINLSWADNSTGEQGFIIARKVGEAGTWDDNYQTLGANTKTLEETGLTTGETYYYRVKAYYSTYNTITSNEINVTTTNSLENGLVAYYPFDEGRGFSSDITVNGATLTTDHLGNNNRAFYFDGVDDYIYEASLFPTGNMSFVVWFNSDYTGTDGKYIMDSRTSGNHQFFLMMSGSSTNYEIQTFHYYDGDPSGETLHSTTLNLNDGNWHQIITTYESSSNSFKLYLDGVIEDSGYGSDITQTAFNLGRRYTSGSGNYFNGKLSSIQIWNKELTSTEVSNLYNEASVSDEGLVFEFPFAYDNSENSNNGIIYGSTTTTDRFGVAGSAYDFDGVDDYVEITSLNANTFPNTFSFSVWTKLDSEGHIIGTYKEYDGSFALALDSSRILVIMYDESGTGHNIEYPMTIDTSQWYNIIVVNDDVNNVMKLYVDGVFKESNTDVDGGMRQNGENLLIGSRWKSPTGVNYFFDGNLDDIRIYNRALTEEEIGQLYHEDGWDTK